MPQVRYTAFAFGPSGLKPFRVGETAPTYQVKAPGACIGLKEGEGPRLVERLKKGLPVSAFGRLQEALDIPAKALAEVVHIPVRTLSRRKGQGRFDVSESERVYRVAALFDRTVEVMGSEEAAREWLKRPAKGLGGKVPLAYAETEPGAREVERLLGRIEWGVFT